MMIKSLAVVVLVVVAATASADPKPECSNDKPHTVKIEVIDGKPVMVIQGDIVICHHLPAPGVAYVTAPKTINYEWEDLRKQFLPLILTTVKKAPL
jgi:hypothetical protein